MTLSVKPGPPAEPADRLAARHSYQLVQNELARVRAAALAWRNGVAGLLAGLVGFGLIKGRTDVSELAAPYDLIVGCLLLAALVTGVAAALLLLRAAHGRPASIALRDRARGYLTGSAIDLDHTETLVAARALSQGLALSIACLALLAAAVGTTWYGPGKAAPVIEVVTPYGLQCGEPAGLHSGILTLRTSGGNVIVDLVHAVDMRALTRCPPGSP